MRVLRSFFPLMLAAVAAVGWSGAFALDNQKFDESCAIYSSGAILPNTDTVTADTGMPPPLIVASFESNDQAGNVSPVSMFSLVGQNGHYRSSVAAAPPLISALFPNTALSSATFGIDLAGTLAYNTSQTADYWSGSGTQNAGAIIHAVIHDNDGTTTTPHGTQASSSA